MYLGVDVGGTKTLVAVLDENGVISEQVKFLTPKNYDDFLAELGKTVSGLQTRDFKAGGIGIPVTVFDRGRGIARNFGHLPWKNVNISHDVERISHCPMAVENDAKLAGLSEALLLKDQYQKVLYITVSTGIGIALIKVGVIDTNIGDAGGRAILLEHKDKLVNWDGFGSGHAIVERYGKKAAEIEDEATWRKISRDIAKGLIELIAITEPDVIVIGGSVGTYFDRYGKLLEEELKKYHLPIVPIPPLRGAKRPEEAVIYGCYDLAKQVYGHARAHN